MIISWTLSRCTEDLVNDPIRLLWLPLTWSWSLIFWLKSLSESERLKDFIFAALIKLLLLIFNVAWLIPFDAYGRTLSMVFVARENRFSFVLNNQLDFHSVVRFLLYHSVKY